MIIRLSGPVIVTGAFGALGRAVVAELTVRGAQVVAVDLAAAPDDHGAAMALGGVDLAEPAAVDLAFAKVREGLGDIAGLVNLAGGFVFETVADGGIEAFDQMYRTNLRTAAVACRAALPHFAARGGAIVNVGAAAAGAPGAGLAAYAASKAGVRALTESLAQELRPRSIRVNSILPTILDTPANRRDMPDADRSHWIAPAAAARVIAFLLSPDAAAVSGASLPLTVGQEL